MMMSCTHYLTSPSLMYAAVQCPDQEAHHEDQVQLHPLPATLAHPQAGGVGSELPKQGPLGHL